MKLHNTFLSLCLLLPLVLSHHQAKAQELALPDTPVGKMATAFFKAFNAEDETLMRDFTANHRTESALKRIPVESRMAQHRQIKGMFKNISPRKITSATDQELVVIVYSEALQSWFECSFGLSESDPDKLESFGLKPTTAPTDSADDGFGEWSTLEELLQNAIAKHKIPAISMAVIDKGQVTETAVAGVRQVGSDDLVQINDRFHLGSITKSMTATLVGRLIEQGKLNPESTLKSLLPEIDMLPGYEKVTVTQLLHHTAGIPAYLTVTDEEEKTLLNLPGNATEQRLAFARKVLQEQPANEPGEAFVYSNAGYSILGLIVEKLGKENWNEQLAQYVYEPLDMKTAGIDWPRSEDRPGEPAGHFGAMDELRIQAIEEYELGAYIEPAGDAHASMKDLARYGLAHMNGINGKDGILKSATFQWLHQPLENKNYAAGWFVTQSESGVAVHEHSGSAGTFLAMIILEPENNRGWAIAANAGGVALDGIFRKIIATWRDK